MLKSPFQSPAASAQLLQRCACVCIIKPRKTLKVDLTHVNMTEKDLLSFFLAIYKLLTVLKSEIITRCQFHHNPDTWRRVNRWILPHISRLFKPLYQYYSPQFLTKQRQKKRWTSKQPFAIYFILASCNVCPVANPEVFAQAQVSCNCKLKPRRTTFS